MTITGRGAVDAAIGDRYPALTYPAERAAVGAVGARGESPRPRPEPFGGIKCARPAPDTSAKDASGGSRTVARLQQPPAFYLNMEATAAAILAVCP